MRLFCIASLARCTDCARVGQVALTPASDTSDLLGSYEQAEPNRAREAAEQRLVADARAACAAVAASGDFDAAAAAEALWRSYISAVKSSDAAERIAALQAACASTTAATAAVSPAVASAWSASLAASFDLLVAGPAPSSSGNFEWVDGILLKAMAAGDWVLLDNANLCSPTVLDRLNPLLEPAGELLVPEAGLVGGAPLIATPAPGFRLLLALDPSHGDVSRAMRNRGIEVFVLQSDESSPMVRIRTSHSAYMRIASIRVLADTPLSGERVCPWVRGQTLRTATLVGALGITVCGLDSQCSKPRALAAAMSAAFSPVRHTCSPSPH